MRRLDFLALALIVGGIAATQAETLGRALAAPVTAQLDQITVQITAPEKD